MTVDAITNFFHCTADNIGDRMCGPGQYLWPTTCENLPLMSKPRSPVTAAIVGGGQIFAQLGTVLDSIKDQSPQAKVVAWGVGLPLMGRRDRIVRQTATHFSAFGTRNFDWREHLDFVPCASCLSPLLDNPGQPKHEIVAFLHRRKDGPQIIPDGIPVMTNAMRPAHEVIGFIASGETIVTSSYHGVYWAQLLGRRVVCLPYNDKFQTFQHPPTIADPTSWYREVAHATRTEPLLEEYRALNRTFAQRIAEIWGA